MPHCVPQFLSLPRAHRQRRLPALAILIVVVLAGCTDVTDPDPATTVQRRDRWVIVPIDGPLHDEDPTAQCLAVPSCTLRSTGFCACDIEGVDVSAAGGESPEAPPQPPAPPPGWTWPDPDTYQGGGYPPAAPGSPCDPSGFLNSCYWTATVTCPQGITRGSTGTCSFSINPSSALDYISGWRFQGAHTVYSPSGYYQSSWTGTIVESGTVTVEFVAQGSPGQATGPVTVVSRSSGIWTQSYWESKLQFVQGQGSPACGPARPISGSRMGWTGSLAGASSCVGQRIEPTGGAGYTLASVPSGPNQGLWYVANASFYFKSTSQLSAGVFSSAQGYTLTNASQVALCQTALGLPPGSTVTINFWNFNNTCEQVPGWGGFISAAWDHEHEHFTQAETVLKQPGNNMYTAIEGLVRPQDYQLGSAISATYSQVQNAASTAGGNEPSGNWTTPFWIWASMTLNEFWYVTQGF